MCHFVSGCTQALFRGIWGMGENNSNIFCGVNTQCQFPLISWHSLFFKWVGALWNLFRPLSCWWTPYVWSYLNFSKGCGTYVEFGRWIEDPVGSSCLSHKRASQAIISSQTSPRSPFPWQCQNSVVSLSDPGYWDLLSKHFTPEQGNFVILPYAYWELRCRQVSFFKKNMELLIKNSLVRLIAFRPLQIVCGDSVMAGLHFPEIILGTGLVMAGTGGRWG